MTNEDYEIVEDGCGEALEMGQAALPFVQVPEWVMLAPLSHQAFRLYVNLLSHVNQVTGDRQAWPGRAALARRMGYKKIDRVDEYIKELVRFGILEKRRRKYRNGGWATNLYKIHVMPPQGYEGALSNAEDYEQADSSQTRQESVSAGHPLPPEKGVPPTPEKGGTPERGGTYPPSRGEVAPKMGGLTIRREQHEENETKPEGDESLRSSSPSGGRASAAPAPETPSGQPNGNEPTALFDAPKTPPTGNDLAPGSGVPGPRSGGRKVQRSRVLAEGWRPSEVAWQRALRDCPLLRASDLEFELQQAISYSQAHGKLYRDHDQMWLNWVRRANQDRQVRQDRQERRQVSGGPRAYRDSEAWGTGPRDFAAAEPVPEAAGVTLSPEDEAFMQAETDRLNEQARQRRSGRNTWS